MLFTYAPNSVILGFVGMFVGIVFWILVLGLSVQFVVVPTMIVLFFHGATAGIFGNSTGGVKGALLGGFIISTIVALDSSSLSTSWSPPLSPIPLCGLVKLMNSSSPGFWHHR